jgi:hypothetical protein
MYKFMHPTALPKNIYTVIHKTAHTVKTTEDSFCTGILTMKPESEVFTSRAPPGLT